jgi:hypothetical protein
LYGDATRIVERSARKIAIGGHRELPFLRGRHFFSPFSAIVHSDAQKTD